MPNSVKTFVICLWYVGCCWSVSKLDHNNTDIRKQVRVKLIWMRGAVSQPWNTSERASANLNTLLYMYMTSTPLPKYYQQAMNNNQI